MTIHRAYRYELDPSRGTEELLRKHCGAARWAWNWGLAERKKRFAENEGKDRFTDAMKQHKDLVKLKHSTHPWLAEVSKCAPQQALRNLDRAFRNMKKTGAGFPKFKRRGVSRDSFWLQNSISLSGRYVKLPRLGCVRLKERPNIRGEIKSATVSRVADRWFVSFHVVQEYQFPVPPPPAGEVTGVDLGISHFATLSDGTKVQHPKPLAGSLERIRRAQRALSRKQKGSKNRAKAALRVAKLHRRVANVRKDFLHKVTTMLAKTKRAIVVEDLNVSGMVKNRHLARSIMEQGWREFRRQLEYKTEWYGSKLVVANRFFASSKTCSACGEKRSKLLLSVREWTCQCGAHHDRDVNAARNLRQFGGVKPVESPLAAEPDWSGSTSNDSMNQEAGSGSFFQ